MKFGRREILIATAAAALAVGGLTMLSSPRAEAVQSGAAALAFSAVDETGRTRTLDEFAGKIVVLEWSNDRCPYVKKHYDGGAMQTLQREATGQNVVWLTVVSSAPGKQGHVTGAQAQALTSARNAAPTAVLLDPTGAMGRAYGARTTPHMYVIGADRKLAYQGGIDDRNSTDAATLMGARNYVREALIAVRAGRAPEVTAAAPYGCTIKYADS